MSVVLNRTGGVEPVETTALTTTDPTTILTGLNYLRTVEAIVLANEDASNAVIVLVEWLDSGATAYTLWNGEVAAKSTTVIDNIPINLGENYKVRSLRATAASANDITVTVITSAQTQTRAP